MASFGTRGGGDRLEPPWRSGKGGATLLALAHDIQRGKSLHQPRSPPSKRDLFLRIKFVDASPFRWSESERNDPERMPSQQDRLMIDPCFGGSQCFGGSERIFFTDFTR